MCGCEAHWKSNVPCTCNCSEHDGCLKMHDAVEQEVVPDNAVVEQDTPQVNETVEDDLLEAAWGIIANAHGGKWEYESKEWQDAARHWRDRYHNLLGSKRVSQSHNCEKYGHIYAYGNKRCIYCNELDETLNIVKEGENG